MKAPIHPNVTVPVTEEQLEIARDLAREHVEVERNPIGLPCGTKAT
jgi:hypothetical protein